MESVSHAFRVVENHSSDREVNDDLQKAFLFYAIVNYQFKTRESKNERRWWSKQFKPLSPIRMDWKRAFLYNLYEPCGHLEKSFPESIM